MLVKYQIHLWLVTNICVDLIIFASFRGRQWDTVRRLQDSKLSFVVLHTNFLAWSKWNRCFDNPFLFLLFFSLFGFSAKHIVLGFPIFTCYRACRMRKEIQMQPWLSSSWFRADTTYIRIHLANWNCSSLQKTGNWFTIYLGILCFPNSAVLKFYSLLEIRNARLNLLTFSFSCS